MALNLKTRKERESRAVERGKRQERSREGGNIMSFPRITVSTWLFFLGWSE